MMITKITLKCCLSHGRDDKGNSDGCVSDGDDSDSGDCYSSDDDGIGDWWLWCKNDDDI